MIGRRPVVVMQLPEELSAEEARLFLLEVEPCLKTDRPRVVLDCSRVQQLDNDGIQVLLHCLEEAMKRNGDVKLANLLPETREILEVTRLDSLFESFDSSTDAVNSFYQFPMETDQPTLQPQYPTSASESVRNR